MKIKATIATKGYNCGENVIKQIVDQLNKNPKKPVISERGLDYGRIGHVSSAELVDGNIVAELDLLPFPKEGSNLEIDGIVKESHYDGDTYIIDKFELQSVSFVTSKGIKILS